MTEASRNATHAYTVLANTTLLEEDTQRFKKLAHIASHLKQKKMIGNRNNKVLKMNRIHVKLGYKTILNRYHNKHFYSIELLTNINHYTTYPTTT